MAGHIWYGSTSFVACIVLIFTKTKNAIFHWCSKKYSFCLRLEPWRYAFHFSLQPPAYVTLNNDGRKCTLHRKHKYFGQVQGQLALSGRQWCDFFIYSEHGYLMERIEFDAEHWNLCVSKLEGFFLRYVLPRICST